MKITQADPPAWRHGRGSRFAEIYKNIGTLEPGKWLRIETEDAKEKHDASQALRRAARANHFRVSLKTDPDFPYVIWCRRQP